MIDSGDSFRKLAAALEPWLDQVVIIGGWAHRLYRLHPRAAPLPYEPLMTLDTDIALPLDLPPRKHDIHARLTAAGFQQKLLGDDQPPATHYHLGDDDSGFYAEFLTPLTGSVYDRKGKRKATVEAGGVSTQRLRHLEILLCNPWTVSLGGPEAALPVQIANPVSFIAQKILIQKERRREDRAKDILYVHDTIELFGPRLVELRDLWRNEVAPVLTSTQARELSNAVRSMFGAVGDGMRRAALISGSRGVTAETVREVCDFGLTEIFGSAGRAAGS